MTKMTVYFSRSFRDQFVELRGQSELRSMNRMFQLFLLWKVPLSIRINCEQYSHVRSVPKGLKKKIHTVQKLGAQSDDELKGLRRHQICTVRAFI